VAGGAGDHAIDEGVGGGFGYGEQFRIGELREVLTRAAITPC
jgi:hypothetical protein